jgi:hypothetical protein
MSNTFVIRVFQGGTRLLDTELPNFCGTGTIGSVTRNPATCCCFMHKLWTVSCPALPCLAWPQLCNSNSTDVTLQHVPTSEIPNVARLWETVSVCGFHNLKTVTNFAYFICLTVGKYSFARPGKKVAKNIVMYSGPVDYADERWVELGKSEVYYTGHD